MRRPFRANNCADLLGARRGADNNATSRWTAGTRTAAAMHGLDAKPPRVRALSRRLASCGEETAQTASPYLGTDFPAWVAITLNDNTSHKISTFLEEDLRLHALLTGRQASR